MGRIWGFGGFFERVFGLLLGVLMLVVVVLEEEEEGHLGGGVGVCKLWRNGFLMRWLGSRQMRGGCLATFCFCCCGCRYSMYIGGFVSACLFACLPAGVDDVE